jgi:cleavage and polyadenylation specificity factor subunit 1
MAEAGLLPSTFSECVTSHFHASGTHPDYQRGVPITKRRRFNELSNAEAVWFLPIQRHTGQRLKGIPDNERSTLLFSSEGTQTRIFALSSKINPEQIGRIAGITINAAPFFQRSCVVHVSPSEVNLLDSGKPSSWSFERY